jgi:hypothetical protein
MDANMELLTEMGINLTNMAIKGTVSAINTKVKAIKNEKDIEKLRNCYDQLINELLSEREEAVRIAQIYKSEIEKIEISDKDIEHLHKTVGNVLNIIKEMSPNVPIESFIKFQQLINIDTLKAMQLLGFNYKAAIGEPLTHLCANAISSKLNKTNSDNRNRNR